MSEQKKISVGAALLAFGIGGAFAGACMAGLAYLMARHGLRRLRPGRWQALRSAQAACSAGGWLHFFSAAVGWSVEPSRGQCSYCS